MSASDVDIAIKLEGDQEIYHSGETVNGVVVLKLHQFIRVAVLKAELDGVYTYWYKHGGFHKQEIIHAEVKMDINGKVSDIPPGNYKCPFSFNLHSSLPSSLLCTAGSVEYYITGKCGYKLSKFSEIVKAENTKYFSVNKYVDLNVNPGFSKAVEVRHVYKPGRCFWLCGEQLVVTMVTNRTGFVAGEKIELSASIDNDTSRVISETEMDVVQVIKTRMNYLVKQRVVRKERGVVMNRSHKRWINETLLIPSVPPSSTDNNMAVNYILRMLLTLDNGKVIKIKTPIEIGNIPIDTNIIEGARSELSFMGTDGETYVPSYIVYRFSPDALPSAPAMTEPSPVVQEAPQP